MSDNPSTVSSIREFIGLYAKGRTIESQIYTLFDLKSFEVKDSLYHMQLEIVAPDTWADAFGNIIRGLYSCILDACTSLFIAAVTKMNSLSIQLSVSYVQNAKPGDTLLVDCYCIKTGSKIDFANATIKCRDNLIALGAHSKQRANPLAIKQ